MSLAASMLPDDALRARDDGFELDVHLNWYRSLPLSSLKTVEVTVNGEAIDRDEITWVVNGAEHRLDDLGEHWDELWFVLDPATIRVPRPLVKPGDSAEVSGPPRQPDPVHPDRPGPGARVRVREVEDAGGPMSGFKLSTTLFALTNEWLSREYTFESLVDKTVELGLGPGLEIVGFQSVRGYPARRPRVREELQGPDGAPQARALLPEREHRPGPPPRPSDDAGRGEGDAGGAGRVRSPARFPGREGAEARGRPVPVGRGPRREGGRQARDRDPRARVRGAPARRGPARGVRPDRLASARLRAGLELDDDGVADRTSFGRSSGTG